MPLGQQGEYGGWFCPCHGSVYDTAGRIRQGPGAGEPCTSRSIRFVTDTRSEDRLSGAERMEGHSTYQPKSGGARWLERRLPIIGLVHSSFIAYPTPRNLNYWWTFGAHPQPSCWRRRSSPASCSRCTTSPHVTLAFNSVEAIMRDVNYGWLLRYLHANGASLFFFAVYIHIFRGIYYGSYKEPREVLWILGVLILLLMIATAFMGYVLPWGQMSFWAATVITNLFSAIPLVGESIIHVAVGRLRGRQPRRSTASTRCTTCCRS